VVVGTAALRNANNALEFIMKAESILSTKITIIDGIKEAELIYKGASIVTDFSLGNSLLMDIGGGSTELMIIKEDKLVWSQSYKLGVGVLHEQFHKSEPIDLNDIKLLHDHVFESLDDFRYVANGIKFNKLVGASGSFEVLESMTGLDIAIDHNNVISIESCQKLTEQLVKADYNQRMSMPGLPETRVKLIVVAMLLIQEVLEIAKPGIIEVTPYALKEGILNQDIL
jgi:exopolyphosphatase/guanosine-5'-triphosphate,3'-diphosphate pyrophosphatase